MLTDKLDILLKFATERNYTNEELQNMQKDIDYFVNKYKCKDIVLAEVVDLKHKGKGDFGIVLYDITLEYEGKRTIIYDTATHCIIGDKIWWNKKTDNYA